jgi:phage terminase large subunit
MNAVRQMLPMTRFHNTKRVQRGLARLRRYCRKKNDAMGTYGGPLHDENSHGADAFGEYAVNRHLEAPRRPKSKGPARGIEHASRNEIASLTPAGEDYF